MQRKLSDETSPADWFYLAQDRLHAADVLWAANGLTASGIELLQEAVERYLKGYLIANFSGDQRQTVIHCALCRVAVRLTTAMAKEMFGAAEAKAVTEAWKAVGL